MGPLDFREHYRRNLPHWQPRGHTFFVTFRLAGTLPRHVLDEYEQAHGAAEAACQDHGERLRRERLEQWRRRWFRRFETELDGQTVGPTWLAQPALAELVCASLHFRNGHEYDLDAFCVMANHVHSVFRPLGNQDEWQSLPRILHSLKSYTSHECNRLLGRQGPFWHRESYDHWVRGPDEWNRVVRYVLNNPCKAGLVGEAEPWPWSWVRPDAELWH